jgi:hypothetical protein
MNPKSMPRENTEDTFLGIELDVFLFEALKRDVEVINQVVDPLGFNHDVINVGLDGWPNVFSENVLHAFWYVALAFRRPKGIVT